MQETILVIIKPDGMVKVTREQAGYHSIRGSFGRITTKGGFENVGHVSSDATEAEREIKLWFCRRRSPATPLTRLKFVYN